MRLSPKPLFFGLITVGLPIAVTIGWMLATPIATPVAAGHPVGAGSIGTAPTSAATTTAPVAIVEFSPQPTRPRTTPPVTLSTTAPSSTPHTTEPSADPSTPTPQPSTASPLPSLTMPPVPTPTDVTEPPDPWAVPSDSLRPGLDDLCEPRWSPPRWPSRDRC